MNDALPSPTVQLMALSYDQSDSSECTWIGSESAFPKGCNANGEGSTNGLQLTTHREREKYPWIAKTRAGTESPSTKFLRARRIRLVSCGFRAMETGKLWMICLLRAAHTSIRQPFVFFPILKMPYKTACCARFGT